MAEKKTFLWWLELVRVVVAAVVGYIAGGGIV